jgi:16S rRNA (guanine527-N7)-methyltransferase
MSEKQLEFSPKSILSKYDPDSKLKSYFDLLVKENQKINLVSRETSHSDLDRLAAESLLPFEEIDTRDFSNYLDIGSGGGFPAIPIIMCLGPDKSFLTERTKKKAAALSRIARELSINVEVLDSNFEDLRLTRNFDLVTLRLVKLSESLMKKIVAILSANGILIYYSQHEKNIDKLKISRAPYIYNVGPDSPPKHFTVFIKQS